MVDWGAMAAASADQVNGILNYFSNEHANQTNLQYARETNEANIALARENNAFQERMVGVNNAFSHDEAALSREFNAREAEKQRAWESEQAKVRRLEAAGLNPALAFSAGGTAAAATSTPASPHGSGVSPSLPNLVTPHYQAFQFSSPSESIKNMAEALSAMSHAKKEGVETDTLEKSQEDVLRKIHAEGKMSDLEAILQERYADKKRSTELKQMDLNLARTCAEIYDLAAEGDFKTAQTRLTELKQETEKQVSRMTRENADIAEKENKHWFELFDAKLNNLQSQTAFNRAGAYNQSAQARFTESQNEELRQMMQYNVQIRQNAAQMSQAEVMKQGAVLYEEINYLLSHYENLSESEKYQLEQVKYAAKMAEFKYDLRWCDYAMDTVERINNGANKWAPWAFSRTDNVLTTNDTLYDGSTMKTETRTSGYKPAWQK